MSSDACTRCGRPLVGGACPQGHPQRATRRRRRRWKLPLLIVFLVALTASAAYAGLVLYPTRTAGEWMGPASRDFASTLGPLEAAVDAFPENGDAESLREAAGVLDVADAARAHLTEAQARLEEQEPLGLPVVSDRPPLRIAAELHEDMQEFHVSALELVGDLEAAARYLTQLAPTLPTLDNLETALGDPGRPAAVQRATAAARPIAEQLLADLQALSAPDEVSAVHASLDAIARGIRSAIDDLERLGTEADSPVIQAVLDDLESQRASFRGTATAAPSAARESLAPQVAAVDELAAEIVAELRRLEAEGVGGLTIP